MTHDEKEWLDALAGRVNGSNLSPTQIEALAVRRALTAYRAEIEEEVKNFNSKEFEKFKAKLIKQGLIKSESKTFWSSMLEMLPGVASSSGGGVGVAQKVGVVALVLVIGLALKVSYFGPKNDDAMLLRGDANVTYIIDANVDSKVNELVTGLKDIKADFTQEQENYGKVVIKIMSSDEVLTYLSLKRIEPKVIDGYITIVVTPPNLQSK